MPDSYVVVDKQNKPTTWVGPDATHLFQGRLLAGALKMYASCGMIPTRGYTITKMLAAATTFSGKKYKRGDALKAREDVMKWCAAMESAMPIEQQKNG